MAKVSFDFDDTLSYSWMQMFAKRLVKQGHEVWCVTARESDKKKMVPDNWNDDLYAVCDDVGIPENRIKFMNLQPKHEFFKDSDFIWHMDDFIEENREINNNTSVRSINQFIEPEWQEIAMKLLKDSK